jgi:hypothetical protein
MKHNHPTNRYHGQGNVHKVVTPVMREQIVRLKRRLDKYAVVHAELHLY